MYGFTTTQNRPEYVWKVETNRSKIILHEIREKKNEIKVMFKDNNFQSDKNKSNKWSILRTKIRKQRKKTHLDYTFLIDNFPKAFYSFGKNVVCTTLYKRVNVLIRQRLSTIRLSCFISRACDTLLRWLFLVLPHKSGRKQHF